MPHAWFDGGHKHSYSLTQHQINYTTQNKLVQETSFQKPKCDISIDRITSNKTRTNDIHDIDDLTAIHKIQKAIDIESFATKNLMKWKFSNMALERLVG